MPIPSCRQGLQQQELESDDEAHDNRNCRRRVRLIASCVDSGGANAGCRARARHDRQASTAPHLGVKSRDGTPIKVKLADDARVLAVDKKSLADVKQGVFVGITAMPLPDGTQKAVEIHIFPEAMRGTNEGHRPWDLMPNSTMTNANIDSAVVSADGKELVLKYKDGEKKVHCAGEYRGRDVCSGDGRRPQAGRESVRPGRQKAARRHARRRDSSYSAGTASIRRCKPNAIS